MLLCIKTMYCEWELHAASLLSGDFIWINCPCCWTTSTAVSEHVLMCSWQLSFLSLPVWTYTRFCSPGHLLFEFLLLLGPSNWFQLASTAYLQLWSKNHDIFPYELSRHLTTFLACSEVGGEVKGTCFPLEWFPVAQSRKNRTKGKFSQI